MSALVSCFESLDAEADYAVLFGGPSHVSALNQYAILGIGARQTLSIEPGETRGAFFNRLALAQKHCHRWPNANHLPFSGGLVGLIGYEFYPWCDEAFAHLDVPPQTHDFPTALFLECESWLVLDLENQTAYPLCDTPESEKKWLDLWQHHLQNAPGAMPSSAFSKDELTTYLSGFQHSLDEAGFIKGVDHIQSHILAGDLYQANLSIRFEKIMRVNPFRVFETLCAQNPSPFSGMLKTPQGYLISNSPERLFKLQNGLLETRPIAGTRGRGKTPEEDTRLQAELLSNAKERAEHLMLVDLERNDLGRVCKPGSVEVNELLTLEPYSHVTHLVSNITGQLADDKTIWDALRSLFPGGTITGCPKIRCIDILRAIEPTPRGFYTGSLGYIDAATGHADFNILIRSLLLQPQASPSASELTLGYNAPDFSEYTVSLQAGAGIVADSIGAYEYGESLKKAHAILGALHACESRAKPTTRQHGYADLQSR